MFYDAISNATGQSLNDCLYLGLALRESLFGVLLWFCINQIAFISDIEKAFLQIFLQIKFTRTRTNDQRQSTWIIYYKTPWFTMGQSQSYNYIWYEKKLDTLMIIKPTKREFIQFFASI